MTYNPHSTIFSSIGKLVDSSELHIEKNQIMSNIEESDKNGPIISEISKEDDDIHHFH